MPEDALVDLRDRLIDAAAPNVAFDGWSLRALREAAASVGAAPAEARWAFPDGARDMVDHYLDLADRRLADALDEADLDDLRVRERVALGVKLKLEAAADQKEAVRLALAHLAAPGRSGAALRSLYRTVDLIWRAAGDRSTDYNFYTKRGLLAGVYVATLLFWLRDESESHAETWRFLDARIGDVLKVGRVTGGAINRLGGLTGPVQALATLRAGLRGLGMPAAGWRA